MKFIKAENFWEWIGLKTNMVPMPMINGLTFGVISRIIFTSMHLNIFEAVKDGPATSEEIAQRTGLHSGSLQKVLNSLVLFDYFRLKKGRYYLTKMARRWCLKDSPYSYYYAIKFDDVMCRWMDHLPVFLKTGQGLDVHKNMNEFEWQHYQVSMEYLARWYARGMKKLMPLLKNPKEMLDIGGSHGLYSVELCKKYPDMNSIILELPEAVEKAHPILKKHYTGDKIKYLAGNAVTSDFGENKYDLILMSHLMHHLKAEDNYTITRKAARALKPGGCFVVQEYLKPASVSRKNMTEIISDLIYNITSSTHTLTLNEVKEFQNNAGLLHCKTNRFTTMPVTQICAKKI
jgi:ubiquinone/menaquinone biosynthesis C-methylase UbiE